VPGGALQRDVERNGELMSLGEGGDDEGVELQTMNAQDWPTITQFSVFLENRVGQLLELVRAFSGSRVKILGMSISDSADCCIVRLIVSHPEQGRALLRENELAFSSNDLLVTELPGGPNSIVELCTALLRAEINLHYAYPLIVHPHGRAAIAIHVDNTEQASVMLRDKGFEILSEADLFL
jgi:hypothetical protein